MIPVECVKFYQPIFSHVTRLQWLFQSNTFLFGRPSQNACVNGLLELSFQMNVISWQTLFRQRECDFTLLDDDKSDVSKT